jgi:tRNA-dihydrouridine synthase
MQGYSGQADWNTIAAVVQAVKIPVIGNGDITSALEVKVRRDQSGVAGVMIGRGAMSEPWIFREIKHYLSSGVILPPPSPEARWDFIKRHCRLAVERAARGGEITTMHSMRARLMAYSHGMAGARALRLKFQHVSSLADLDAIAQAHLRAEPVDADSCG